VSERTPYEVLGIDPGATEETVRQAFLNLLQIYHPDRFADSPPGILAQANRHMQEVNAAYDALAGLKGTTVYYDTPGWTNRQRAAFTRELLDADIPHRWNGEELSVDKSHETKCDRLFDEGFQ
jgi:DnaJ-class molecular chaperone